MGSSNKHWPSLFRSRPSSSQSDSNSPSRRSASFPSVLADGSEERTPEPKPRWNPKPEQIRILEAIFNSGMVNPPRDEISKIRAQLQEYGQVGDANVFYWFQNRKSRSKAKNRQQNSATRSAAARRPLLAPSSSSSSSDRSSNGVRSGGFLELSNNSSTGSVNQNYSFPHHQNDQYLNQLQLQAPPPYSFPGGVFGGGQAPGVRFNDIMGGGGAGGSSSQMESFSRMLLGDQMMTADNTAAIGGAPRRSVFEDEVQQRLTFMNTNPIPINVPPPSSAFQFPSTSQVQGVGGASMAGPPKSTVTVFINEMPFEVPAVGPFNVQETFGDDVVLLNQSGHPVPTNTWGATVHPLTHGASYHLARLPPAAAAPNHLPFNYKM